MKTINYYIASACAALALTTSCQDFDNYAEPEETLKGSIVDKETGKPFQTETGDGGVRIKLLEYSWSDNPVPYYFTVKQDGTFQNTKIFAGHYNVEPLGAFVPLVQADKDIDESVTTDIKGTVDLKFEVEPFLRIEYVGEPVVNDNKITVQAKITRGTDNPDYQQDVTDVWLFTNFTAPYVGENNKNDNFSFHLEGDDARNSLGRTITLTTKDLKPGRTYYIRVGARIDKSIDGRKRYNYTEVKSVKVP